MKRLMLVAGLMVMLAGCSIEGSKVGGCVTHEKVGAFSGVAWAECPADARYVYVPGGSTGWASSVAEGAIGGGLTAGSAIVAGSIPKSLSIAVPTPKP